MAFTPEYEETTVDPLGFRNKRTNVTLHHGSLGCTVVPALANNNETLHNTKPWLPRTDDRAKIIPQRRLLNKPFRASPSKD